MPIMSIYIVLYLYVAGAARFERAALDYKVVNLSF